MQKNSNKNPAQKSNLSQKTNTLANFADIILSIAREIELHTEQNKTLIHLTPTEINIMRYIEKYPGCLPKDAALAHGLQRSNFSLTLHSLRKKKFIDTKTDINDGRKLHLYPTDKALKNLIRHKTQWANLLIAANIDIDVNNYLKDLKEINRSLEQMRENKS